MNLRNGYLAAATAVLLLGCNARTEKAATPSQTADAGSKHVELATTKATDDGTHQKVEHFCGGCHATPQPPDYPRTAWREEVEQGFQLFFQSNRTDLRVPILGDVIRYYEERAPESLPVPPSVPQTEPGGLEFHIVHPDETEAPRGVAHVSWQKIDSSDRPVLLEADMRSGEIRAHALGKERAEPRLIAKLQNPCHVESTDLDGDARPDLVVADLGSFLPADHDKGSVAWLRPDSNFETWETHLLATGLGRVADVQAGDMDADGDLDLVVAEFGWRKSGRLVYLKNLGLDQGIPKYETQVLDERHGAIHVPIRDVNADGKLDFVALMSQEHESVELFAGDGTGRFEPKKIFDAASPSFGSSGIQIIDLDRDGDEDVVATNGDMFDDFHLRVFHGIRWIENVGQGEWKTHELANMPGVHRALAADMDGDMDLDIVACALVPSQALGEHRDISLASVIWLEQRSAREFVPHVLEVSNCVHATMEAADFDGDGDVDLAFGTFFNDPKQSDQPVSVWWNKRIAAP